MSLIDTIYIVVGSILAASTVVAIVAMLLEGDG